MNRKNIKITDLWIPLFLLVLCVLAYGLLISTLGYYWDDWPYAWINHMYGPAGFPDFVALDRPHSAWIFMLLTAFLGEKPLGYHVSSLLLFWLCAVLFWRLLRLLWPEHHKETFWAALLFSVYPGFLGHPQAIIYNHHFAAMALYLFSFIGMVKAVQASDRGASMLKTAAWHLPALAALVLSQFTIEYFLGWEAARLLVAWLIVKPQSLDINRKVGRAILHVFPYGLVTLAFLVWRVFIFQFPTYQPVGTGEAEFLLGEWLLNTLSQFFQVVFVSWRRAVPQLSSADFSLPFWVSYLILSAAVMALVLIAVLIYRRPRAAQNGNTDTHGPVFGRQALVLSLVGLAFAGWPFWLTDLTINIRSPFNSRFTMAFMPWIALFFTAFLHWFSRIRSGLIRFVNLLLIAFFVGGSAGFHFWNANFYRNEWLVTQRYFQQMVRRIPDLTTGTTLVINDLRALSLYQDDSLTAILNWTYAPENTDREIDFMVHYLSVRLGRQLPALEPGLAIEHQIRSQQFSGSTDQLLVVYYQPPGCLRVLDYDHPDRLPEGFPNQMVPALPLSKPGLINTNPDQTAMMPLNLFKEEDRETWCLYFEEADLAAQQGDWSRVANLGDDALKLEDQSNEVSELFVFIEAYLRMGRMGRAKDLSERLSVQSGGYFDEAICGLWQEVDQELGEDFASDFDLVPIYNRYCGPE